MAIARPHLLMLHTRFSDLQRRELLRAAVEAGVHIILAAPRWWLENLDHGRVEHRIVIPDRQPELAARIITRWLDTHGIEVDGLMAVAEESVELAAELGAYFGLPASPVEAAHAVRNKIATRHLLAQRVPEGNPRYAVVRTPDELALALAEIGAPAVLKPAGSSGSRGVMRVASAAQFDGLYDRFRAQCAPDRDPIFIWYRDAFLVEEWLEGDEHSVCGSISGGHIDIWATVDKRVDHAVPMHCENIIPSRLPEQAQAELRDLTLRAVGATGLDNCGFHVDLIRTPDGPRVLEIGGRAPGEYIASHLLPIARPGFSPYQALIEIALGRRPPPPPPIRTQAGWRALRPPNTGRLLAIRGLEKLARDAAVIALERMRRTGDILTRPNERFNHFAVAGMIVSGGLDCDLRRLMDQLEETVTIEVASSTPTAGNTYLE